MKYESLSSNMPTGMLPSRSIKTIQTDEQVMEALNEFIGYERMYAIVFYRQCRLTMDVHASYVATLNKIIEITTSVIEKHDNEAI